jgi:hypothetical protein
MEDNYSEAFKWLLSALWNLVKFILMWSAIFAVCSAGLALVVAFPLPVIALAVIFMALNR